MATIDDFGDTSEPLNNPPLGGPSGWAAAVRDYITGLPAQIAANTSAIAGKVAKAGDTMTGPLVIEQDNANPQLTLRWNGTQGGAMRPSGSGEISFRTLDNAAAAPIGIGEPTSPAHAATKNYADGPFIANSTTPETNWNNLATAGSPTNVLMNGLWANGPGTSDYFYVVVFQYNSDNLTQVAIPYMTSSGPVGKAVWLRGRYQNAWSVWGKLVLT